MKPLSLPLAYENHRAIAITPYAYAIGYRRCEGFRLVWIMQFYPWSQFLNQAAAILTLIVGTGHSCLGRDQEKVIHGTRDLGWM